MFRNLQFAVGYEQRQGLLEACLLKMLNAVQVPQQLTVLACLSRLDLSANSIAKVPPQLGVMHPTLKQLALDGNPLRTIRQAVLQKGTPALLEYLRGRIPGQ